MKGLLLNNLYSMSGNIRLSFIMAMILVLVPNFIGESSYLPMIISMQIFIFVANTGTSLQIDESSKWNKFELTLPAKRRTIINAKYLSFIMLIAIGILASILTPMVFIIFGGSVNINSLIWGYCFGLTLSISSTSFMYPIMLKIGAEKSELIIFLAGGLSLGIMVLISCLLSLFIDGIRFSSPIVGIVALILSILLFAFSYLLAVRIYSTKEF